VNEREPTANGPERVELSGDGVVLVGDRWDGGEAPRGVLVLLPGGGQTRHSWDGAAGTLSRRGWTVYTLDPRGHGESQWAPRPKSDYGIAALAADVASAVHDIGERDPGWTVLVGASMGGMAAMTFAAEVPDGLGALVLVDITPTVEEAGTERIKAFMNAGIAGFDSMDDLVEAVARYRPDQPARDASSLRHNIRRGDDGRIHWHWDPEFQRPDNGLSDPELNRTLLLSAARQILVPTLVVRGAQSDVVSDDGVAELMAILPTAETASVAGAGHMVVGDDNDSFIGALLSFVEAHVPRS
jgi:pimeloyl-ACP methyl ester carboxylesterase